MMINNRRPYMGRQDTTPQPAYQNMDVDSLKNLLVESLKQLNRKTDEMDKSFKTIEEKLDYLDTRLMKVEDRINRNDSRYSSTNSDLSNIRSEIESLRKDKVNQRYYNEEMDNRPVMPGTGFAGITPEYLKSLAKNRA